MSKIKKVFLHNKRLLKNLVSYTGYDFFSTGFAPFPFDIINQILPLRFKMFHDAYLILDNKKIKGFISLEKEKGSRQRININKFFLNSNSFEYGEQLINYVTSRYGAMGATTFNIKFDNTYEEMINLLVNNCKFRISSAEVIYKIDNIKVGNNVSSCFLPFSNSDAKNVAELEASCIDSYLSNTFCKNEGYFKDGLISELDCKTRFKYIFKKNSEGKVYGYFCIFSIDNQNYIIDLFLDLAYSPYFMDILNFCNKEIQKRSKKYSMYLRLNKYYKNFESHREMLEQSGNSSFIKQNVILTKDYYVPVRENEIEQTIIFDTLNLNPTNLLQ